MRRSFISLCVAVLLPTLASAQTVGSTVRFYTSLGHINVQLLPNDAPNTVTNFLNYVNRGTYTGTFIHRSETNIAFKIFEGGTFSFDGTNVTQTATDPPVAHESSLSNTRGTVSLSRIQSDPNSGTSQFFFNLRDTDADSLDHVGGGFTVFGRVADGPSLAVMDAIGALPTTNAENPFAELPVRNYTSGTILLSNLIVVDSVKVLLSQATTNYTIAASPPTLTIPRGQSKVDTLTVTPVTGFTGTVTFSCGAMPSAARCAFSPASLTFSGTTTPQKAFLTVSTAATAGAAPVAPGAPRSTRLPVLLLYGLAVAMLAVAMTRTARGRPRLRLGMALSAVATACGGSDSTGPGGSGTPKGSYTVPVALSDGTGDHPFNLSVVVQ